MFMHEETLMGLGLSLNEARVYESMLSLGEVNVNTISIKSKVHRRNVYDSLNKLMERGLVTQFVLAGEKNFCATDPRRLTTILKDKQDKLDNTLLDLTKKFLGIKQEEQALIYRGIQGYKNYLQDILDVKEDIFAIGAKGGWYDPRLETYRLRFYKELKRLKLNAYHLFDHEMRDHVKKDVVSPVKEHLSQSRFLPPEASTNSAIDFFGDRIVMYTGLDVHHVDDNVVVFVLISKQLAESMRKWFWVMWSACKE